MGIKTSLKATYLSHSFSMNKRIDNALVEKLPDLIDEYKLAERSELDGTDKRFRSLEGRMKDLETWKGEFRERLSKDNTRVELLKRKYGVK